MTKACHVHSRNLETELAGSHTVKPSEAPARPVPKASLVFIADAGKQQRLVMKNAPSTTPQRMMMPIALVIFKKFGNALS